MPSGMGSIMPRRWRWFAGNADRFAAAGMMNQNALAANHRVPALNLAGDLLQKSDSSEVKYQQQQSSPEKTLGLELLECLLIFLQVFDSVSVILNVAFLQKGIKFKT